MSECKVAGGGGGGGAMAEQVSRPVVTFILETLGLYEDDFSGPRDNSEIYTSVEALCESIYHPILTIIDSFMLRKGVVDKIYVNVENYLYLELKADEVFYTSESFFTEMLEVTIRDGTFRKPATDEVVLRRLPNPEAMLEQMPLNTLKIGCTSGPVTLPMLADYLANVPQDAHLVIVVGDITNARVTSYLDETVKVSNYDLNSNGCVICIRNAVEAKYNLRS